MVICLSLGGMSKCIPVPWRYDHQHHLDLEPEQKQWNFRCNTLKNIIIDLEQRLLSFFSQPFQSHDTSKLPWHADQARGGDRRI